MKRELIWSVLAAGVLAGACSPPTEPPEVVLLEAATETRITATVDIFIVPAPRIRALDQNRRPVAGARISFSVTGGGSITNPGAVTDERGLASPGVWRLGTAVGTNTLTASAGDRADVVFTAVARPGPVATIATPRGQNQVGKVNTALRDAPVAQVLDGFGNPVPEVAVHFSAVTGGGFLELGTAVTDAQGLASPGRWTLGPELGGQQVRARVELEQGGSIDGFFIATACDESCSPSQLLVFVRDGELYQLPLLGGESTRLPLPFGGIEDPSWSPNGRRLAFVRFPTVWPGDVYVANGDGSAPGLRASGFNTPAWSPDGQRLAVTKGDCIYNCELFLLSATDDGSLPRSIANMVADPAWSPDGTRLAFVQLSGDDGYHSIRLMDLEGNRVGEITSLDEGAINHPSWSPDGTQIAYSKCLRAVCEIFVASSSGTSRAGVPLTNVGDAFEPSWSPDGLWIAFTSNAHVAVIPAGGGSPAVLVPGHSPTWRP